MNMLATGARVGFMAICLLPGRSSSAQAPSCEVASVWRADSAWARAVAAQDQPALLAKYASTARLHMPGAAAVVGRDAIAGFWRRLFPAHKFEWSADAAVVAASCDLAYTRGTYRWTPPAGANGATVERGKYVALWQRGSDGVWRILEDIWNASP